MLIFQSSEPSPILISIVLKGLFGPSQLLDITLFRSTYFHALKTHQTNILFVNFPYYDL